MEGGAVGHTSSDSIVFQKYLTALTEASDIVTEHYIRTIVVENELRLVLNMFYILLFHLEYVLYILHDFFFQF